MHEGVMTQRPRVLQRGASVVVATAAFAVLWGLLPQRLTANDLLSRADRVWLPTAAGARRDSPAWNAVWLNDHELVTVAGGSPMGLAVVRVDTRRHTSESLPAASAALSAICGPSSSAYNPTLLPGGAWALARQYVRPPTGGTAGTIGVWAIRVSDGHTVRLPDSAAGGIAAFPHGSSRMLAVKQSSTEACIADYRLDAAEKGPDQITRLPLAASQGYLHPAGILPDGRMILFASRPPAPGDPGQTAAFQADLGAGAAGLSRLPLDVGTGGDASAIADGVSSDGRRLAWLVWRNMAGKRSTGAGRWLRTILGGLRGEVMRTELWVAKLDGTATHRVGYLNQPIRQAAAIRVQWIPETPYLSFSVSGRPELWQISVQ